MRNTSAPGISTWPTTRAGSADSVAWISSMVKSFIAITQYHEPGMARMRVATENWYTCTATSSKPSDSLERPRKAALLMNFRMSAVSDLLEPYEGKLSRTDLRGGGDGNIPALPGGVELNRLSLPLSKGSGSETGDYGLRRRPGKVEQKACRLLVH